MKIVTGYDYAAWPAGGFYAYDESTYDGPEYRGPFAHGESEADAIEELAAQWASMGGYEDFTTEDLDQWETEALERGDLTTLDFVHRLREFV